MTARTGLDELSSDGAFKRTDAAWRNTISNEHGSKFPPEKDRYHLYVAHACPWAHRAVMTRALKGLEDVISITVVMPIWQRTSSNDCHIGWMFADHSGSGDNASCHEVDLEPEDMKEAMAAVDSWIYPSLNNGVYRCGLAQTQEAYDAAIDELTAAFDRAEDVLAKQRFIAGNRFTLSDIRLFVTLLRFDEVYAVYFKTNTRSVANSPVLLNYCREIYQMPGVAETVDMHQIKEHYFCSHPDLNKFSIVPRGPDFERLLQGPHDRDSFDGKRRRRRIST
ncbi:hypothetical protein ACHAWT_007920 [Skeletonema menzelii]